MPRRVDGLSAILRAILACSTAVVGAGDVSRAQGQDNSVMKPTHGAHGGMDQTRTTPTPLLVTAAAGDAGTSIRFCLQNQRKELLDIDAAAMPWATRYSAIVVATKASGAGTE